MHRTSAELSVVAPPAPARLSLEPGEEIWHLTLDQIESHTGRILSKRFALAEEAGSSTFPFDQGNVLYSKLRPYLGKVVRPVESGIATSELIPLRPRRDLLDPDFLVYYLRSNQFTAFATQYSSGAKMPRVIMSKFWRHEMPLPPLSEQRRILEILDQADRILHLRAEADAVAERILSALFLQLFGDPIGNPRRWNMMPLGQLGSLERGVSRHRPRNEPSLLGGPYPLIQTGEITNCGGRIYSYKHTYSELGLQQSRLWPAGTLCITIAANIAQTGILELDACFPDSVVGFSPHELGTTEFIQAWLGFLRSTIEAAAPGFAQKNINLEILSELPVIFPPRALRELFSEQARVLQRLRYQRSRSEELLSGLLNTLLRRAFTGELTAAWREAHMKELLQEMEIQAKALASLEARR